MASLVKRIVPTKEGLPNKPDPVRELVSPPKNGQSVAQSITSPPLSRSTITASVHTDHNPSENAHNQINTDKLGLSSGSKSTGLVSDKMLNAKTVPTDISDQGKHLTSFSSGRTASPASTSSTYGSPHQVSSLSPKLEVTPPTIEQLRQQYRIPSKNSSTSSDTSMNRSDYCCNI